MSDVRAKLEMVFREVFRDPSLVLRDEMTADDVDGWDSLEHINLIIAVERTFGVRFATAEIAKMKEAGNNVGTLVALIAAKAAGRP